MQKEILEKLNWRYATKQFKPQAFTPDQRAFLEEALRLTPSSFGQQLWRFVWVDSPLLREELKPFAWNQRQITEASALVVLARPLTFPKDQLDRFFGHLEVVRGKTRQEMAGYEQRILSFTSAKDERELACWMDRQLYIALGNLMTAAALAQIDTCPIEGFEPAHFDRILGFEKLGLKSVVVAALGFRSPEDAYQHQKKLRFEAKDVHLKL